MIHTKVRVSSRRGENLLMEPKQTTSPRGMAKTRVSTKTLMLSTKPISSSIVTGMNILITSLYMVSLRTSPQTGVAIPFNF